MTEAFTTAITGLDFSVITGPIMAVIPVVLPVSLGLIGIRKALSFFRGQVR